MDEPKGLRGPARAWSIVAMSLLCIVLGTVLLREPMPAAPRNAPRVEEPTEAPPPLTPEERRSMYRAWPMFEGWPLPQLPAGDLEPEQPSRPAPREDESPARKTGE
ncbi:hypothetical protein [Myxococcus sp. CA056]|uniref:hypothetical protein n=1 Tax=Myxococcus sp. CA056 TaxID=2741740 RepID=UPI00352FEEF9